MAYILRRKGKTKVSYRVQVRRRGFTTTFKSYPTRTEAKKWSIYRQLWGQLLLVLVVRYQYE